jgi:hypothetical protein
MVSVQYANTGAARRASERLVRILTAFVSVGSLAMLAVVVAAIRGAIA